MVDNDQDGSHADDSISNHGKPADRTGKGNDLSDAAEVSCNTPESSLNAGDKKPPKRDQAESLLRFISRELKVNTIVSREGNDFFVLLEINGEIVGRRRLNKAKCCRSESPCIGTIPVSLEYQDKYGLPSFIHVSICYDEISDTFSRQAQTYPRTH